MWLICLFAVSVLYLVYPIFSFSLPFLGMAIQHYCSVVDRAVRSHVVKNISFKILDKTKYFAYTSYEYSNKCCRGCLLESIRYEPRHEKTCLRWGLRPGWAQTGLLSDRSKLEA